MNTLYLDIFSGISGDMFIGALLDAGVEFNALERELRKLDLDEYHLHATRGERCHIAGTKFDVHLEADHHHDAHHAMAGHDHHHPHHQGDDEATHAQTQHIHAHGHHPAHDDEHDPEHDHHHDDAHDHDPDHEHEHEHEHGRTFADIRELIGRSELSAWVKERAIAVFRRIAEAEGRLHGQPAEAVHFHEVGAVDSIVDVVGACVALDLLGRPRVLAGPVVDGTGFVHCAHGRFPIPAPATLEILARRGVPVSQCDEPHELVTPTGAALLAEFAEQFVPLTGLTARRVGYGLGTRENKTRPNVLRVVLGDEAGSRSTHDWETDTVAVLETNLDDITAEVLGAFAEKALSAGALDVFHTPVQMKKNRPGVLLSVLCVETDADRFAEMILRETTAFGVRRHVAERRKLRRESISVTTPHGTVSVKLGRLDGRTVQAAPEYESCRAIAERAGVPLKKVYEDAIRALDTLQL